MADPKAVLKAIWTWYAFQGANAQAKAGKDSGSQCWLSHALDASIAVSKRISQCLDRVRGDHGFPCGA
jgi:hypothetical protein